MKRLILFLILVPFIGFSKSNRVTSSADAELSTEYKTRSNYGSNFLGVELLGRGVLYSLNYDRAIMPKVSIGAGVSYYQFNIGGRNYDLALLPLYANYYIANYYYGNKSQRVFITGGANVFYMKSEVFDAYYMNSNSLHHENEILDAYSTIQGTSVTPSGGIGYEFRLRSGFTFRGTAYLTYSNNQVLRWYGATLGTHF